MLDFFYTLIIFPIETVISVFYWVFLRMFEIHGIAIICLSVAVNIILLPLYNVAERWQQRERDIQAGFKEKLDDIKAVFKGAERHMIIRTYYRQNHYHPFYSMRSVLGLAIQIPFFIAAYHFLSHMPMSEKTNSWYFLKDLMRPDALLTLGGTSVNLMPVVMTVINLVSAFVYSGKLQKKEKNQLFIMALLFLVLLYNSPSGLVLYWTMNNVISLIKNIINSTKNPKKYFYITFTGFLLFMFVFSILLRYPQFLKMADLRGIKFNSKRIFHTNILIGGFFAFVLILPFLARLVSREVNKLFSGMKIKKEGISIFILSCSVLFLLTGIIAPSLLISASPLEFTEIISDAYYNPSLAIFNSALQAFAFFIFIPGVLFFLFSDSTKKYLLLLSFIFSLIALVNIFIFPGSYGVMSPEFIFENPLVLKPALFEILMNSIAILIIVITGFYLIKKRFYRIISNTMLVVVISLTSISFVNIYKINTEFANLVSTEKKGEDNESRKVFRFSSDKQNVLVIMLDRAMGGLMGEILDHNPEFLQQFSGFKWFSNTASFNGHTLLGAPPLYGGYEYTPVESNKRDKMTLIEKHNEALLMMPRLFSDKGYEVNISDPSIANYSWIPDLSIYEKYPEINANVLVGKYTGEWINENIRKEDNESSNMPAVLKEYLLNFSFFRIMPNFFRSRIYDNSRWLKPVKGNLPLKFINHYSVLYYLPKFTGFITGRNTFNMITNETTHEPDILELYKPEYFKSINKDYKSNSPTFSDRRTLMHFYTQIDALRKLVVWFNYLKENGVYDNTKIIIVSDHGRDITDPYFKDFSAKEKIRNQYTFYHPLLMFKDFNSTGNLEVSDDFMTNADAPTLATSHITGAVNPFTGKLIKGNQKKNGIDIVAVHSWREDRSSSTYKFKFSEEDIVHVKDNIFLKENWSRELK